MKRSIVLSLALVLAPAATFAQSAPPPGPPPGMGCAAPNAAQMAAMRHVHAQAEAAHAQTRARLLAALTPAHRTAVANIFGQLAVSVNPDPRAAAQSLDALLSPAEKQSVLTIAAAERANMHALMQQARAAFESTLSEDQRAQLARREAKRAADPGAIVLRTLSDVGGRRGMLGSEMHGRAF
jgi:hypothetical protein